MLSHVAVVILVKTCLFFLSLTYGDNEVAENDTAALFKIFVEKYNKSYEQGTSEYLKRLSSFGESLERIKKLNSQRNHSGSALYGITEFSDLKPDEFILAVKKLSYERKSSASHDGVYKSNSVFDFRSLEGIPNHIDWRDKKIITAVKNQKKCGACWAFSTVETIESMNALKTGKLEELSVQEIIDCAKGDNDGCEGGDTCGVLDWMSQNKVHIVTEKEYPLTDVRGECQMKTPSEGVQIADNYTCFNFVGKEEEMLKWLAFHGPLVVAVDASGWQDYLGGIIQYHCETNRNHAVQIVGYNLNVSVPYYMVRNSWGVKFGLDGYLHIAIGRNLCGIALEVSALDVL